MFKLKILCGWGRGGPRPYCNPTNIQGQTNTSAAGNDVQNRPFSASALRTRADDPDENDCVVRGRFADVHIAWAERSSVPASDDPSPVITASNLLSVCAKPSSSLRRVSHGTRRASMGASSHGKRRACVASTYVHVRVPVSPATTQPQLTSTEPRRTTHPVCVREGASQRLSDIVKPGPTSSSSALNP